MSAPRPVKPLLVVGAVAGLLVFGAGLWLALAPSTGPVAPPSPAPQHHLRRTPLFFADAQGMYLVPKAGPTLDAADPGPWAREVFRSLQTAPAPLVAAVPPDASLVEASVTGKTWVIKVRVPGSPGSTTERLLVGALVRTYLDGMPGTHLVRLSLVDAQDRPLASQHFDLSAPLGRTDVMNEADTGTATAKGLQGTLWWPTRGDGELVPVHVALAGRSGIPPRDAFERLLEGPPKEAGPFLTSVVPGGVKATWARLDDHVARIEVAGALPASPQGARFVEATVLTLTEFPDVKAVQFVHGGQPIARTIGPFRLQAPVARPAGAAAADRP